MVDFAALSMDYWNDLMVRMAHHSTAIEGNTLSQGDTKSLLLDGYIPRAMDLREMHEVLNYKRFMDFLHDSLKEERVLSLDFIKEVHAVLCKDAIESVAGRFKQIPNIVVGADFVPTPLYLVSSELQDWLLDLAAQLAAAKSAEEKIAAICRQHIRFERIHPFADGNGRVGRALIIYSCLQEKEAPIIIPVGERKRYINYLNTEDLQGFIAFAKELQEKEEERLQLLCEKE